MDDIQKFLSLPEGKTLEFKRDLSSPQPILRALVAFANTEWEELGTSLRVTLYPHSATQADVTPISKSSPKPEISKRQQKILELVNKKGPLTARQIFQKFKGGFSERTLRADLNDLKNKGYLILSGKGPGALWSSYTR